MDKILLTIVYKNETLEIPVEKATFDHLMEFANKRTGFAHKRYSGVDANDNAFRVEVGVDALAITGKPITEDENKN